MSKEKLQKVEEVMLKTTFQNDRKCLGVSKTKRNEECLKSFAQYCILFSETVSKILGSGQHNWTV